ncbi:MAG TPA: extracellular solute-binding protein [Erysipelotrichaceae bacterium]|nr:extracellular solute-binding protein [Erysipelotrichaceae bacterium]
MKTKSVLFASALLAISSVSFLVGCTKKYDYTLTIYNWEDYIYEGTDEDGNIIGDSLVEMFEQYYEEKTDKTVKVNYECFSTNEEMYQQISLGAIKPDLICPSDYMIQRMANEGKLESFNYDVTTEKYDEKLDNWNNYGSPFINDRFSSQKLKDGSSFLKYAVPYFWGTMGFTYDPEYFTPEQVSSWSCLWSTDDYFKKQFSLKDSMRDTYVTAIFYVYSDEIGALDESAEYFNEQLSDIFNRCDDATIALVETALIQAKSRTVYGFEVDEGKDDIVRGIYHANLAWSGDSVYSMDSAESATEGKILNYSLPSEGSNVWFDGWCMPKGANVELAQEFINFICKPENAALCMDAVGYTSPIVGDEMWELVNEWCAAEDEADTYEVDLSFYFGDSIEGEALIDIPLENKGRQFDAQYPTEEVLNRCCLMKDFGTQTGKVEAMWTRVKGA